MENITVTEEMIEAGNQVASDLIDAELCKITKADWRLRNPDNPDLIEKYLNDEIDAENNT